MSKIILAATAELKDDRDAFERLLRRKSKSAHAVEGRELLVWPDFLDGMSPTRLQAALNQAMTEADVLVLLFFNRIGKATAEAFEQAWGSRPTGRNPLVFGYFKDAPSNSSSNFKELAAVQAVRDRLKTLGDDGRPS